MSLTRYTLLVSSVTWLIVLSVTLFLTGNLKVSIESTLWLLASVLGFVVLVGLTTWAAIAAKNMFFGSSPWWGKLAMFILPVAALVITILSPMFAMDWGVAEGIRAWSMWSFMPEGNLLFAENFAGWVGLMYLAPFVALITFFVWNLAPVWAGKLKQSVTNIPERAVTEAVPLSASQLMTSPRYEQREAVIIDAGSDDDSEPSWFHELRQTSSVS